VSVSTQLSLGRCSMLSHVVRSLQNRCSRSLASKHEREHGMKQHTEHFVTCFFAVVAVYNTFCYWCVTLFSNIYSRLLETVSSVIWFNIWLNCWSDASDVIWHVGRLQAARLVGFYYQASVSYWLNSKNWCVTKPYLKSCLYRSYFWLSVAVLPNL